MEGRSSVVVILLGVIAGCGNDAPLDAGSDASPDCTPFGLIPDATEYFYDGGGDADASCGDPLCPGCDAGAETHPAGTVAILPTQSGSDLNCRPGMGDLCACFPLACYCGYDTPGQWYCPN